jgi:hypothetical protein
MVMNCRLLLHITDCASYYELDSLCEGTTNTTPVTPSSNPPCPYNLKKIFEPKDLVAMALKLLLIQSEAKKYHLGATVKFFRNCINVALTPIVTNLINKKKL